jgi:hypothetical protein
MNEKRDAFSLGDKYGLLALIVFVAGVAVYNIGYYDSDNALRYYFQSFPYFLVPLAIVLVGVGFFMLSGRAFFRSWKKRNERVK